MKCYKITYINGTSEYKQLTPNGLAYLIKQSFIPVSSVKIIKK